MDIWDKCAMTIVIAWFITFVLWILVNVGVVS